MRFVLFTYPDPDDMPLRSISHGPPAGIWPHVSHAAQHTARLVRIQAVRGPDVRQGKHVRGGPYGGTGDWCAAVCARRPVGGFGGERNLGFDAAGRSPLLLAR